MNSKALIGAGFLRIIVVCACVGSPGKVSGQSVYSVNALAYADVNLVAGSNLAANPFSARDNSVSNLFYGVPDGSFFVPWNAPMGNYSPTNSFTQAGGWTDPSARLVKPNGGFLWVPTATTLSFVGELWQGGIGCVQYPAGPAVLSDLAGCPILCDNFVGPCPGDISADGSMVGKWNGQTQSYEVYQYLDGFGWIPDTPTLAIGESAEVWSPVPFSVRAGPGGAGTPARAVRATGWQRDNDNMTLRFAAMDAFSYTVLRSLNLSSRIWDVLKQGSANPTGGMASITVTAETNPTAFYRLVPAFSTAGAVLMNASRGSNQFRCEFYAPIAASYELERTVKLTNAIYGAWQKITTVVAGPSNVVTVTDTTATASSGYYRLRYNPNP